MTEYTLPHFGKLQPENLEEYYDVSVEFNGNEIIIDLNFENKTVDTASFDSIKYFIENINSLDKQNLSCIISDFNNESEGIVKEYITFHLEELGDEFLKEIDITNSQADKEQQFLAKLHLTRVGLYPDGKYGESYFAVFDYTIGKNITDQLIVVKTNNKGNLRHLCSES